MLVGVDPGVEEEIDRRPAGAARHAVGGEGAAEVVAAVVVAEIALRFVVARGAGQGEGVVAAHGVAHHFQHGLQVAVVEAAIQAGPWIGAAVEGAGHGRVEVDFAAGIQAATVEGDEVRALPSGDVQHLDVLAGTYRIVPRRAWANGELVHHLAQRRGQRRRQRIARIGPVDQQAQFAGPHLAVDGGRPAGRGDHHQQRLGGMEAAAMIGRCAGGPQARGLRQVPAVDAAPHQAFGHVRGFAAAVVQQVADEASVGAWSQAEGAQRRAAAGEGQQLGALIAFEVDHLQPVARLKANHRQAAGGDAVAFQARRASEQRRLQRSGYHGGLHARLLG